MKIIAPKHLVQQIADTYDLSPSSVVAIAAMVSGGVQGGEDDDKGAGGGGGGDGTKPGQQSLPGVQNANSDETAKLRAEMDRMLARDKEREAELAKYREADDKRRQKDADARRKQEEEEAAKRGEYKTLAEKREAELEEARRREDEARREAEGLRKLAIDRIENDIARLPKNVQEDIAMIRDGLPMDRLQAYVARQIEIAAAQQKEPGAPEDKGNPEPTRSPPAPNPDSQRPKDKPAVHELHPETRMILEETYQDDSAMQMGKVIGKIPIGRGNFKFTVVDHSRANAPLKEAQRANTKKFIDYTKQFAGDPTAVFRQKREAPGS